MKDRAFLNFVLSVVLAVTVGWLLYIGRPILIPVVVSVIAVYLIVSATEALRRIPLLGTLPTVLLRAIILLAFIVGIVVLAAVITATVRQMAAAAPGYQQNLTVLLDHVADMFGVDGQQLWSEIRRATIDRINIQNLLLAVLGGFTSAGSMLFLIILYSAFLIAERGAFLRKLNAAFPDETDARRTRDLVNDINQRISDYLAVKTLVNLILAGLSYVILWAMGVDFALFWAVLIGILNYIPYVGSYLGVAFPVVLSLAQFASPSFTVLLTVLLTAAQVFVGSILDPRMVGRHVNLSPFVVLVALSLWTALWGIPGAILAIPLTSIVAIVLSGFPRTRFIAIFLASRIETTGADLPGTGTGGRGGNQG